MKRFAVLTAVSLFLAVAFPLTAQAQMESESGFKIGPRATIDVGDIEEFAIGGDVRYDLSESANAPIQLSGAFDFYFPEGNADIFSFDINGHYVFPTEGTFSPYAGAGIGITSIDLGALGSTTDTGLNLVGGAEFDTGSFQPFIQGQFTVRGDFDRFAITGGILFAL